MLKTTVGKKIKAINKAGRQPGFTLIELLVVIAVIGLLSSIVLVSMSGARAKARDSVRQADIRQIGLAMEMFYPDVSGASPVKKAEEYYPTAGGANAITAISTYMSTVPSDPSNTAGPPQYQYVWVANSGDLQKYCVYARLEGTANFICSSNRGTLTKSTATVPTLTACCY